MKSFKVVVSDDRFGGDYRIEESVLRSAGAELVVSGNDSDFLEAAGQADAVLVNLRKIDAAVIEKLPKCRILSRYGVGYDNIDVPAASRAGIWVSNVPDYSIEEVSDQALALLMACARLIVVKDKAVRSGHWNYFGGMRVNRICGTTLGLVGYGAIARRFHRKASGLDFKDVLVYDPFVDKDTIEALGGEKRELDEVVSRSDFISVHAPLNPGTRHLVGESQIALMKPNAIIINTSRGPVVDETALCSALSDGRIRAAGLDVFETEPLPAGSPLRSLENVVLSDHCSYYSEESTAELKEKAARNIASVLKGERPQYPIDGGIVPRSQL